MPCFHHQDLDVVHEDYLSKYLVGNCFEILPYILFALDPQLFIVFCNGLLDLIGDLRVNKLFLEIRILERIPFDIDVQLLQILSREPLAVVQVYLKWLIYQILLLQNLVLLVQRPNVARGAHLRLLEN